MNIGQIIKKQVEDSGIKITAFAEKINVSRNNVYDIFNRNSIDTELLKKISEVLNHDFFQYYRPINEERGAAPNLIEWPSIELLRKREEILTRHIQGLEKDLCECHEKLRLNVIQ